MAAATLSPVRAVTGLPSMVTRTCWPASSSNLLNIEPPRREGANQICIEPTARDHRRKDQGVIGGQRDAGMAADDECAGVRFGLIVDRKAVLCHDADARPGPDHVEFAECWKHAPCTVRLDRCDREIEHGFVGRLLAAIADHDATLVGLP